MSNTYRGDKSPKLQNYIKTWSPVSGYVFSSTYRGFDEAAMQALMNTYTNAGIVASIEGAHDVFTLKLTDSTQEYVLDTWSIQQSDERVNCLQNPLHKASGAYNYADIISLGLEKNLPRSEVLLALTASPAAQRLYTRMADGATEFVRSVYILKHTTNAPSNYSANIADFNVDRIYTTSQLLSETTNSGFWLLPLPGSMQYFINSLYFPPTPSAYYTNGWLKRGASRSTAANFRTELSTEYWMGQISNDEYQLAYL